MNQWLERLRIPFFMIGGVLAVAAAGYYAIQAQVDVPMRVLAALAVLFLGLAIAIDPGALARAFSTRSARYGANSLVLSLAVLLILGLGNFLAQRHPYRWDFTEERQFTLSEQAIKVVSSLPEPVHAIGVWSEQLGTGEDARQLLEDLVRASNGKLTMEWFDPEKEPGRAIQLQIRTPNTVILQRGSKREEVINPTDESDYINALAKLSEEGQRKIYFLTGHREHSVDDFEAQGLADIKSAMEREGFIVATFDLFSNSQVPSDASAVVIAAPQDELTDEEQQRLKSYLDGGGRLMILSDPGRPKNGLNALIEPFGVKLQDGVAIDTGRPLQIGQQIATDVPVVNEYQFEPISNVLKDRITIFPFTSSVSIPKEEEGATSDKAQVTVIAQTSPTSWLKTNVNFETPQYVEGEDVKGPLPLGVAIEENTASDEEKPARVVVFSSSSFVSNQFLDPRLGPLANRDLFLNSVDWLTGAENRIAARPRDRENRTLFLTGAQQNAIMWTSLVGLPLVALAAGLAVWWGRR